MPREKDFSRFDDSASLIRSDCPFELLGPHGFPGFDLDEDQESLASDDKVDLSSLPTEVSLDYGPALGGEDGGDETFSRPPSLGTAPRN